MTDSDELLDADGVLRNDREAEAHPARAYRVFLQRFDARFDVGALEQQAARFFSTKIGLMAPKRYGAAPPIADLARFAVAAPERDAQIRAVLLRPATAADHELALAIELERGASATGLGGLARRCGVVGEVERTSDDDLTALLLAAVFASTHLGPIVDLEGRDLFGVKTARERLARLGL